MNDVRDVQQIRQCLQDRLRNNPRLRINVQLNHPKIHLTDVDAALTGVYAHIFEIAETTSGRKQRHTLQYADVLLRHIELLED